MGAARSLSSGAAAKAELTADDIATSMISALTSTSPFSMYFTFIFLSLEIRGKPMPPLPKRRIAALRWYYCRSRANPWIVIKNNNLQITMPYEIP